MTLQHSYYGTNPEQRLDLDLDPDTRQLRVSITDEHVDQRRTIRLDPATTAQLIADIRQATE